MWVKVHYLFVACIIAASCDPVGWAYPLNRPRSQVLAPDYLTPGSKDSSGTVTPTISPDTILYMCGVRITDGYDWQRDSGIGIAKEEIVFFKDTVETVHFPTGYDEEASTDPDTHHIIDGNLYTEFSNISSTVIKKNGGTILTFDDREYMMGLVLKYGCIYTLGKRRSGRGFCLRQNGAALAESSSGVVIGSFADSSYPQTGALYEDSGSIWFAYNITASGNSYCHIVRDGRDSTVANYAFDDFKVIGGKLLGVRRSTDMGLYYYNGKSSDLVGTAYKWTDCTLFNAGGNIYVAGNTKNKYGTSDKFIVMDMDTKAVTSYPSGDYHLYVDGTRPGLAPVSYEGYHYFSRSCMDYLDGVLYVALSPRDNNEKPLLRVNGKDKELDMRGYITGVQVRLSPPN